MVGWASLANPPDGKRQRFDYHVLSCSDCHIWSWSFGPWVGLSRENSDQMTISTLPPRWLFASVPLRGRINCCAKSGHRSDHIRIKKDIERPHLLYIQLFNKNMCPNHVRETHTHTLKTLRDGVGRAWPRWTIYGRLQNAPVGSWVRPCFGRMFPPPICRDDSSTANLDDPLLYLRNVGFLHTLYTQHFLFGWINMILLPVVPQKALAENSKIGN